MQLPDGRRAAVPGRMQRRGELHASRQQTSHGIPAHAARYNHATAARSSAAQPASPQRTSIGPVRSAAQKLPAVTDQPSRHHGPVRQHDRRPRPRLDPRISQCRHVRLSLLGFHRSRSCSGFAPYRLLSNFAHSTTAHACIAAAWMGGNGWRVSGSTGSRTRSRRSRWQAWQWCSACPPSGSWHAAADRRGRRAGSGAEGGWPERRVLQSRQDGDRPAKQIRAPAAR